MAGCGQHPSIAKVFLACSFQKKSFLGLIHHPAKVTTLYSTVHPPPIPFDTRSPSAVQYLPVPVPVPSLRAAEPERGTVRPCSPHQPSPHGANARPHTSVEQLPPSHGASSSRAHAAKISPYPPALLLYTLPATSTAPLLSAPAPAPLNPLAKVLEPSRDAERRGLPAVPRPTTGGPQP
jgi:hypothetical protein